MKRLVIVGEGHGELTALPILVKRLLQEKGQNARFFVDDEMVRAGGVTGLLKWNKSENQPDARKWIRVVSVAARRSDLAGVVAVFDGDAAKFPAGSSQSFCPVNAAKYLVQLAAQCGAGIKFSLALVFACREYESWLIAGVESLRGKKLRDGRIALPRGVTLPGGPAESHGKGWLESNCPGYRPSRDQGMFTEIVDLSVVRSRGVRSFARLENAIDELLSSASEGRFISTPN